MFGLPISHEIPYITLKTGIPIEEGDSILKSLWRVSCPEIQLGVGFYSELPSKMFKDFIYLSVLKDAQPGFFSQSVDKDSLLPQQSQKTIGPTGSAQEAVYLLVHYKFLRVISHRWMVLVGIKALLYQPSTINCI